MSLGAPELIIILVIVLLLFGGAKLPSLARSLGKAQREFREGVNDKDDPAADSAEAGDDADAGSDKPTATSSS